MPGFGPAAEPLLFRQKWPKPLSPRQATLDEANESYRKADQLAALRQGPLVDQGVRLRSQAAGVGHREELRCSKLKQRSKELAKQMNI